MGKLDGKVAIITGCSGGLGKQIALRFASEGAKLAICARNDSKLQATAEECRALGADVVAMPVDLLDAQRIAAFMDATIQRFGTVDILVNNAVSISSPHPFLEHSVDELNATMQSGLYATWHLMQLCVPYMMNKSSSIINFGSGAGELGLAGYAAYAATKEAIRGLSRVAARELGALGIRVNTVSPSAITDNVRAGIENLPQEMKDYVVASLSQAPMGRAGDPYDDITPVVLFLACEDSRWITGQNLNVEGGGNIHS